MEEQIQETSTGKDAEVVIEKKRLDLASRPEKKRARRAKEAAEAYGRGEKIDTKHIKDRKLRRNLKTLERKYQDAASKAKDAEILLENTGGFLEPEGELERTYQARQKDIAANVSVETAQKRFDLRLEHLGPYLCDYTRNGRDLLLAGQKGHVANMDWRDGKLVCEIQLQETVRDICWLHNNQYFAVAQRRHVYIYDGQGIELHCLRKFVDVTHMQFLPYHFLLATIGSAGYLKYQDTSTGQTVAEMPTRLGPSMSMTQNPYNAVLHVGHQNGTVTLWSPSSQEPLVKLLAHRGPVRSLSIDREGRYMVSAGQDLKMAVWDIRMFKEVGTYQLHRPASSVAISDTGLTAVGWGTNTTIWKGLFNKDKPEQEHVYSPYMKWGGEGSRMERLRWCPYEDILGIGHSRGFSSIIVPGAGEANFDAFEANPFETAKQRQESEVKGLLNKLQPNMIALDPNFIGTLDQRSDLQKKADREPDAAASKVADEIRNKARGRNGALSKYLRKQRKKNVIDEKRLAVDQIWEEQRRKREQKREEVEADLGPALSRFVKRS
ncbi:hypothetical protein L249_0361 [Ophiocordyceps polyrhachis-furcata BCC 54312]|uniref:U three protein 7 n=1 Tax=Ophiocordyceps polyrhachis-furcata BCC 54312 TaxID=1330021 RepID=A0A367LG11_9HYPO|nr:hypothetical protein L249_0361 [Ophiocordyceps polyrhachis-furcata BCC 54312]